MTEVTVVYREEMLDHAPTGYDPNHPDWTEIVKKRLGQEDEGGMDFTHPERPERLQTIRRSLEERPVEGTLWASAEPASRELLELAHTPRLIERVQSHRGKSGWLSADTTAVSEGSVLAAEIAAGCACVAVDAAVSTTSGRSFALVRPPGHHAYADRSAGFCIFNNVAIATQHARVNHGVERVLIVDFDAHHGNGTQAIFTGDPNVMHFDIHAEAPVYPGSGGLFETGTAEDFGTIVNVPVPLKTGDGVMLEIIDAILIPAAVRFRPDLIIVSAGFDGHRSDLLLEQTEDGFAAMTARLLDLAQLLTEGKIAFVLEGGYREALSVSVRASLEVMAGGPVPSIALGGPDPGRSHLQLASNFHNRPVYRVPRAARSPGPIPR